MDYALLSFAYFSYLFVTIAYALKSYRYAKLPLHIRWELYSIPHEGKEGGYLEEVDWQSKYRPTGGWLNLSDLGFHIIDYIFMNKVFKEGKGYWLSLYPYHLGMYTIFLVHIIFGIEGFISLSGVDIERGVFLYIPLVFGAAAFILGSIGCIAMLLRRALDSNLRHYASPKHYFTYCFFFIVFLSGLISWVFYDPTLSSYKEFYVGFATFNPVLPEIHTIPHLLLFLLFLIYLPFTRTLHYVTKLFNYFWVIWEDRVNLKGSAIERRVIEQLNYRVTWSAPHIQTGKKWIEVAQEMPK